MKTPHEAWNSNNSFNLPSRCDFTIIDFNTLSESKIKELKLGSDPVLIKGAMKNWLALEKWSLSSFISNYENSTAKASLPIDIAYKLSPNIPKQINIVDALNKWKEEASDSEFNRQYILDYNFLSSIPEMAKDFKVPNVFKDWDNKENDKTRKVRHFLSMGPDRSGLPLQLSSRSWYGLIEGEKVWYIYIPEASVTQKDDDNGDDDHDNGSFLLDSFEWSLRLKSQTIGEPYVCVQERGDIIYLPEKYTYATVNNGISGEIGSKLFVDEEEIKANKIGSDFTTHFNFLQFQEHIELATKLDDLAQRDIMKQRRKFKVAKGGILKLSSKVENFLKDLSESEDIWVVNFYVKKNCESCENLASIYESIASNFNDLASFSSVDVSSSMRDSTVQIDDSWIRYGVPAVPCIAIFKGGIRPKRTHDFFLEEDTIENSKGSLISIVNTDELSNHIMTEILTQLKEPGVYSGGVTAITSLAKRYRYQAVDLLQSAYTHFELHPKLILLYARILAIGLREYSKSVDILKSFIGKFDVLVQKKYLTNSLSISSIYYSVGQLLIASKEDELGVSYLKKSIEFKSEFTPSYIEIILFLIRQKESKLAEEYLNRLEMFDPKNPSIEKLRNSIWQSS